MQADNYAYLDTRYSNFLETKEAASAGVPLKSKLDTSTASASAAAMAIAGAPRTTMSLIASLSNSWSLRFNTKQKNFWQKLHL
jgi:hypothetical protein